MRGPIGCRPALPAMPGGRDLALTLVSAAICMDMLAYTLVIPVLPSYAAILGADAVAIGIIYGAYSASLLLFSIPFGILSDRIGRRPIMVLGMLSLAATGAIFAFSADAATLVAARLLQGASGAATWSAGLAMVSDTSGPGERGRRLGLAMAAMSAGTLVGPVVGGVLYDRLGYGPTFILPSALAAAVGLAFLLVGEPPARAASPPASRRPHSRHARRAFLAIALAAVAGAAAYGVLEPFFPAFVYDAYDATPTMAGLAFGAMSLLAVVSQPIVGGLYDAHGGRFLVAAGFAASALAAAGCVAMPSFFLTAAVFSLLGITMGFALTPLLPMLSDLDGGEGDGQGMAYGAYNTLFSLGLAAGPLAGGLMVASLGFPRTVRTMALLLAMTGAVAFIALQPPTAEKAA